ncbi:hypothetical protein LLG07_02110 [bacterium]|nr:hypothetical protein [bacterium]
MNIKTIVILIVLALIFTVIFFYFYNQPSEIKSVQLTQDISNTTEDIKLFNDRFKEIFIIIKLSKIKKDENIKILWYKKTDSKLLLIQDNVIKNINDGSGYLKLSLINKNGKYDSGDYLVNVYLNGKKENSREFTIN